MSGLASGGIHDARQAPSPQQLSAEAHQTAGIAAMKAGRYLEASVFFKLANAIVAGNPMIWRHLAFVLLKLDQVTEAEQALERALTLDPGLPSALLLRLDVLIAQNQPQVLLPEAERLVATVTSNPSRFNPEVLAGLRIRVARLFWERGHCDKAATYASDAAHSPAVTHSISKQANLVIGESLIAGGFWKPPAIASKRIDPKKGRVLHVVGKSLPYHQAGYAVRTHSIVREQLASGLDPAVVTQLDFPHKYGNPEAEHYDIRDGITYFRLLSGKAAINRSDEAMTVNVQRLASLVEQLRPSVLHAASDFRNPMMALPVGKAFGIPVVYEVRGFWEETWLTQDPLRTSDSDMYRWKRMRELECMQRADHVVTIAEVMRDEIVRRGVNPDRISVVPNAVDTEAFRPIPKDNALKASVGFEEDEVVLGYISSLSGYEGVQYLIRGVEELLRRGKKVRCLIVGDGPNMAALEALTADRALGNKVTFTGRVPHADIARYYSIIDIFVVPRTADSVSQLVTPLKPYEAMAMERAVLVSGVTALKEMVIEGHTGLYFEPENPESLANVAERLIDDPAMRIRLGRAAREWVGSNRTWARNGERYMEVYRALGAA